MGSGNKIQGRLRNFAEWSDGQVVLVNGMVSSSYRRLKTYLQKCLQGSVCV